MKNFTGEKYSIYGTITKYDMHTAQDMPLLNPDNVIPK